MDAPPSQKSILFARGVIARLAIWPILRLAVQEGWGGPGGLAKRTWLASTIVDAFEAQTLTPDDVYVEEMLLQIMQDEFEATLEDESAEVVARDIVRLWDEAKTGRQEGVLRLEAIASGLKGKKVEGMIKWEEDEGTSSSDEDGEDADAQAPMMLQTPKVQQRNEPEVDEDGFTLVKARGKGRR